jgi:hypothetical protein
MNKEKKIYIVEHVYEKDEEEEIKYIGVFSSRKKAEEAVDILFEKPGFINHPKSCFQISEGKLNRYGWVDGFTSWQDAIDG